MKKISSFVLLIASVLLLCSCNGDGELTVNSLDKFGCKPAPSIGITVTIPKENNTKADGEFTATVGIGQDGPVYNYATLEISAKEFEITDPNGDSFAGTYQHLYTDFANKKYTLKLVDNSSKAQYFEIFRLKYTGPDNSSGAIYFTLTTLQHGEPATEKEEIQGESGGDAAFYYTVRNGKIKFSTKAPKVKGNNVLVPVETAPGDS